MRLALIHDALLTHGGAERVFLEMAREFPEADLYTLAWNPERTLPEFSELPIRTHRLNAVIRTHDHFRSAFPLATRAMAGWDFRGYDLILTSSASTAKYIRRHHALHICYCYFPTRAIWSADNYFGGGGGGLRTRIFRTLLPYFRRRDLEAAAGVDHFIGISQVSADAIGRIYGKEAVVLHSPIDAGRFLAGAAMAREDHFLIVSRLERGKWLDYAIEASNRAGFPLRIVGVGADEERLRAMAGPMVEFAGVLTDAEIVLEFGRARAVIFTPELEYGLVPLEANAAGTPVIALGRGAMSEILVPAGEGVEAPTAVFFPEPTADSLIEGIRTFEGIHFERDRLIAHARRFDIPAFRAGLRRLVEEFAPS